jgi:hypothetical protein
MPCRLLRPNGSPVLSAIKMIDIENDCIRRGCKRKGGGERKNLEELGKAKKIMGKEK